MKLTLKYIKFILKKIWPYIIVFKLFLIFLILNHGVALGDSAQHTIAFNVSNLYFFLFISFFLFLPLNIEYIPDIVSFVNKHKWLIVIIMLSYVFYIYTYEHSHKYNAYDLSFYRHNLLLYYTCDILPVKVISFFLMWWMALTFMLSIKYSSAPTKLYILFVCAVLSIIPMPLIEPRYYFITIILFIAFNPKQSKIGKLATLLIYVLLVNYIMYHISHENFFL